MGNHEDRFSLDEAHYYVTKDDTWILQEMSLSSSKNSCCSLNCRTVTLNNSSGRPLRSLIPRIMGSSRLTPYRRCVQTWVWIFLEIKWRTWLHKWILRAQDRFTFKVCKRKTLSLLSRMKFPILINSTSPFPS